MVKRKERRSAWRRVERGERKLEKYKQKLQEFKNRVTPPYSPPPYHNEPDGPEEPPPTYEEATQSAQSQGVDLRQVSMVYKDMQHTYKSYGVRAPVSYDPEKLFDAIAQEILQQAQCEFGTARLEKMHKPAGHHPLGHNKVLYINAARTVKVTMGLSDSHGETRLWAAATKETMDRRHVWVTEAFMRR